MEDGKSDPSIAEIDALGAGLPPDEIPGYTFEDDPDFFPAEGVIFDDEPEPQPPLFFSVAIVLHDRAEGGPEEGGWWYETYEPVDQHAHLTKIVITKEHAISVEKDLEQYIVQEELNKGRRPISSLLSQGIFEAHIFPGTYPVSLPTHRPHYE